VGNYIVGVLYISYTTSVTGKILGSLALMLGCIFAHVYVSKFSPETKDRTNEECVALF
jgi:hypothetical protein